jgi:hypothetical protein
MPALLTADPVVQLSVKLFWYFSYLCGIKIATGAALAWLLKLRLSEAPLALLALMHRGSAASKCNQTLATMISSKRPPAEGHLELITGHPETKSKATRERL